MTYEPLEKKRQKAFDKRKLLNDKAKVFAEAKSIEEYKINVELNLGQKIHGIDWFVLYYFKKCYPCASLIAIVGSILLVEGIISSTICIGIWKAFGTTEPFGISIGAMVGFSVIGCVTVLSATISKLDEVKHALSIYNGD